MDSRDPTQAVRSGGKCMNPMSHISTSAGGNFANCGLITTEGCSLGRPTQAVALLPTLQMGIVEVARATSLSVPTPTHGIISN